MFVEQTPTLSTSVMIRGRAEYTFRSMFQCHCKLLYVDRISFRDRAIVICCGYATL